jgi:hypothetical protein
VLAAATGIVALVGAMTACSSTPGSRRVVTDLIEGFVATEEISEAEGECMLDRLTEYDDNELDAIADANDQITQTNQDTWTEELQAFRDDFAACVNGEASGPATTDAPGTTAG